MRVDASVVMRRATVGDLGVVSTIAEHAYRKYVERIGQAPGPMYADYRKELDAGILHVITVAGEVVAFAVYELGSSKIFIDNLAVIPGYQGKGIIALIRRIKNTIRRACRIPVKTD